MEDGAHSALLSIVDPDILEVFRPPAIPQDRHLVLRFHDLIEPDGMLIAPEETDIQAILQFGDRVRDLGNPGLLIHCHMGVSRSTAALAALIAQSGPDRLESVFPTVLALRPQAWPNSRMIGMADRLLGLNGGLMRPLRRLYQRQIVDRPDIVDIIRHYGRIAEIKWALFGGAAPTDWREAHGSGSSVDEDVWSRQRPAD
jgi:predicted protein tyrosine phosphatase